MPDDIIIGVIINSTFTEVEVQKSTSELESCESCNSYQPLSSQHQSPAAPFPPELQRLESRLM